MSTETETKTGKYAQSVAKATGGNAQPVIILDNAAAMITKFESSELVELARSGKHEFAPQMMALEEGQKITGLLEGYGPGNDFVDEETGVVRHVDSWIIASPDGAMRVSILSSAQLDRKLPPFIGEFVGIAREKDLKISGGHRCANYHVWGPKMEAGKRRVWATLPSAAAPPALPAGTVNANYNGANGAPREDITA
jgi:hypothetical protein